MMMYQEERHPNPEGHALIKPDPLSALDRMTWAGRYTDRRVYTDDKLRDMLETARPEMAEIIRAELVRRAD